MKLGILADIHEQADELRKAIDVLAKHGAVLEADELHGQIFFHQGDESAFVAKRAKAHKRHKRRKKG